MPVRMTRPAAGRRLARRRPPRCTRPPLLRRLARALSLDVLAIVMVAPILAACYVAAHVAWWLLQ